MATESNTPTRRALLGALAAAPLLTVPALGTPIGATPFAAAHSRYIATRDALNTAPANPDLYDALERRYIDALRVMDKAVPTNWHEFIQKLEVAIGDGDAIDQDYSKRLIAEAKQLLAGDR